MFAVSLCGWRWLSLYTKPWAYIGADIEWIRSITKLPLVIKGIQCVEVRPTFLYVKSSLI